MQRIHELDEKLIRDACINAIWEIESVYLVAELMSEGCHISEADLNTLLTARQRLDNFAQALGGKPIVPLFQVAA